MGWFSAFARKTYEPVRNIEYEQTIRNGLFQRDDEP